MTRACRLARERGALSFVDAVHYAAHALVDVQAIGCDFLACSPYKFYGPHLGVLWGRGKLLADVPVPKLAPAPDARPSASRPAPSRHEGMVGSAAAVEFLAEIAPGRLSTRLALEDAHRPSCTGAGTPLFERLWDGLGAIPRRDSLRPPRRAASDPHDRVHRRRAHGRGRGAPPRRPAASSVRTATSMPSGVVDRLGLAEAAWCGRGSSATRRGEIDRLVAGSRNWSKGAVSSWQQVPCPGAAVLCSG